MSNPSTLLEVPAARLFSACVRLFSKVCPPRIEVAVRKGRGGRGSGCIMFNAFKSTILRSSTMVLFLSFSSREFIPLFSTPTAKFLTSFLFLERRRQQNATMRTERNFCLKGKRSKRKIQTYDDDREKSNGQGNIESVL